MTFLGPAFLLGLLGLALPVAIHLFRRRRLQVVRWAAHRFLRAAVRRHQSRVRLEDLLLLLLRCLVLALIVFAFARPVFEGRSPTGAAADAPQLVILLDLSAGMGWTDGVSSLLDRAVAEAARELSAAPSGATAALIGFSDRVHPLVARPTSDFTHLRRELDRAEPVGRGSDLAPALRAALDLLETLPPAPRRVLVLSDRQALVWRDREGLLDLLRRAREAGVEVAHRSVAVAPAANLAVTRLEADAEQVLVGQPVRLRAELFNGGAVPAAQVRVALHAGDDRPAAERVVSSLPPGGRAVVEFTHLATEPGFLPLSVRLAPDALAADDARSLVVHVSSGVRVLLVEGPPPEPGARRPGFFLARAIVPVPAIRREAFPVRLRRVAAERLEPADLHDVDVVVLAGVRRLAPAQTEALARHARSGGLWVFPPAEPDPFFYNDDAVFAALLPAVTGAPVDELTRPLGPPYAHPVVDLWNDPAAGALDTLAVHQTHRLAVRPAAPGAEAPRVLLRLASNDPLLVGRGAGRGRVLQAALPADPAWSDLPLHPAFVPLVQRGLAWLAGETAPAALSPGDLLVMPVDPALLGSTFRLAAPGHRGEPTPAGSVELVDGRPALRLHAGEPGVYRVYAESGDALLAAYAVNLDPAESDLTPADLAPFQPYLEAADRGGDVVGSRLSPLLVRNLWIALTVAALLLALGELFLAQRFSRSR